MATLSEVKTAFQATRFAKRQRWNAEIVGNRIRISREDTGPVYWIIERGNQFVHVCNEVECATESTSKTAEEVINSFF